MENSSNVDTMNQLYALTQDINDKAQDDGATLDWFQKNWRLSSDPYKSALSAWVDLMPEHANNVKYHNRIFEALFPKGPPIRITPEPEKADRLIDINNSLKYQFPSMFHEQVRRESFAHLISVIEDSEQFPGMDYEDIADMLFEPYMMIDGGTRQNLAFIKKDILNKGLDEDDFLYGANYAIIRALKEGKNLKWQQATDGMIMSREALHKISKEIQDGGGSMWTGVQHPNSGNEQTLKGMEVVIVNGDMDNKYDRTIVGRWVYEDQDKDGNTIWTPLTYDYDQTIKVWSAYKRGNFMDIDNDEDIKENVERWIEDGSSGVFDSIPSGLEEYATWEWGFFNIGKFELEEVVKPFYEKYKHLSASEFAAKWEEVRLQETYAFEEKFFDTSKLAEIFQPYRPSIGPLRYGSRPRSERGGSRIRTAHAWRNIMKKRNRDIEYHIKDTPDRGEGVVDFVERKIDKF